MALVFTTEGQVDERELERQLTEVNNPLDLTVAREWYREGRMVRRDVWVTIKSGFSITSEKGL